MLVKYARGEYAQADRNATDEINIRHKKIKFPLMKHSCQLYNHTRD